MWAYNLNIVYCSYSGISREFQILAYLARFNKETFGTTCGTTLNFVFVHKNVVSYMVLTQMWFQTDIFVVRKWQCY